MGVFYLLHGKYDCLLHAYSRRQNVIYFVYVSMMLHRIIRHVQFHFPRF